MLSIDVKFPETTTLYKYAPVPSTDYSGKLLAQVRSTFRGGWAQNGFQPGKSRPSATNSPIKTNGLPDTVQYSGSSEINNPDIKLTEDLQYLWYENCYQQGATIEENRNWFFSLTTDDRWQTNKNGSLTKANYPCRTNQDKEPMTFFTLLTGNAIIELDSLTPRRVFGELCLPFYCIDASKNVSMYTHATHPFLFYRAMNSVRTKINRPNGTWTGLYKEDGYRAFPQFDGNAYTPLLIASGNIGWINIKCVDVLESNTSLPPIFN